MSDLSEFGGGVDRDVPNPEDDVNTLLSTWLRGADRSVYWDRDRTYGNGTFSVSTRRRPDLLIEGKARNYVVEVKDAEDSSNVHDGIYQTYQYWCDLVDGNATYSVRGQHVEIDAVLIATQHSPEGHLFHSWKNRDPRRTGRSEGAQRAVEYGFIPEIEHAASETATRLLHRFARGYDDDATVGIGSLLSSALDGDDPHYQTADPAALTYTLGHGSIDGKHVENWDYIPWYLDD